MEAYSGHIFPLLGALWLYVFVERVNDVVASRPGSESLIPTDIVLLLFLFIDPEVIVILFRSSFFDVFRLHRPRDVERSAVGNIARFLHDMLPWFADRNYSDANAQLLDLLFG